jgi:hypothetical protein
MRTRGAKLVAGPVLVGTFTGPVSPPYTLKGKQLPRTNRRPRRLSRSQADMQSLRQRVRQATSADLRVERDAATGDGEQRESAHRLIGPAAPVEGSAAT